MPDMDGFETLLKLRTVESEAPVVYLTGTDYFINLRSVTLTMEKDK
jgi:CheY-like chemotaxis protein